MEEQQESFSTKSLQIVDDAGNVKIVMSASEKSGRIFLCDHDSVPLLMLEIQTDHPDNTGPRSRIFASTRHDQSIEFCPHD